METRENVIFAEEAREEKVKEFRSQVLDILKNGRVEIDGPFTFNIVRENDFAMETMNGLCENLKDNIIKNIDSLKSNDRKDYVSDIYAKDKTFEFSLPLAENKNKNPESGLVVLGSNEEKNIEFIACVQIVSSENAEKYLRIAVYAKKIDQHVRVCKSSSKTNCVAEQFYSSTKIDIESEIEENELFDPMSQILCIRDTVEPMMEYVRKNPEDLNREDYSNTFKWVAQWMIKNDVVETLKKYLMQIEKSEEDGLSVEKEQEFVELFCTVRSYLLEWTRIFSDSKILEALDHVSTILDENKVSLRFVQHSDPTTSYSTSTKSLGEQLMEQLAALKK